MPKITISDIIQRKGKGKISMLTCYDYSFARGLDEAGVDIILVGDSLANVVLGMQETRKVSFYEMLNHTRAVASAVTKSLVVADMPYVSYQSYPKKAAAFAHKFLEAGADAVKVEWFSSPTKDCGSIVKSLIKEKIPVMGHIGLTPQTAHLLGGYKVQGKNTDSACRLIKQAHLLEDRGIFSIVLECIPYQLSHYLTQRLKIPTIGIGAGKFCDGQVLVLYDFLGLYKRLQPKFVRPYQDFFSGLKWAAQRFARDIKSGKFPSKTESFSMKEDEWKNLRAQLGQ
jgi:3-methyl-2-oxobutanoate hydroxymethyltransferase